MIGSSTLRSLGHIRHVVPLEVKLGDFLYLHTKHFQTFGIVIREPSRQQTDPFNDVFEIVDPKGNLVWGRLPNVKFYYPSILAINKRPANETSADGRPLTFTKTESPAPANLDKEAFIKTAFTKLRAALDDAKLSILSHSKEMVVEDWAFSLGDQSTFNLWDAHQVLLKCSEADGPEFSNLFSLFQFLYQKSTRIVCDTTYRVNGPFAYRKQSNQLLLEHCQAHFSQSGSFAEISKFRAKLTKHSNSLLQIENNVEHDLVEGMKRYAYCTFENAHNNPFQFIAQRLAIAKHSKSPYEMHDFLSSKGFIPALLNPKVVESNLELNHSASDCAISIPHSKNSLLHEYKFNASIRREYSNSPVFTIDSLRASEIDDGISVDLDYQSNERFQLDNLWFHVHIADCVSMFNPNEQIDLIGQRMVNSVYLPEQTFPMLPWKVTKVMSLEPEKKENYCLTFSFRVDSKSGNLKETRIVPTLIQGQNICKITYASVDLAFNPHLKAIFEACKLHREFRKRQKYLNVELPQPHIWIEQNLCGQNSTGSSQHHKMGHKNFNSRIVHFYNDLRFEYHSKQAQCENEQAGHFIVSEMMIMAGRVASEFCRERNIPIPFRFQQLNPVWNENQVEKWTLNDNCALADAYYYARTAFPAEYGTAPTRHASMGLDCYAKVTSPIRRYVDQLTHQQIKCWLVREHSSHQHAIAQASASMLDAPKLNSILPYINERELRTKWLQRNSARFWVLQMIKNMQNCENSNSTTDAYSCSESNYPNSANHLSARKEFLLTGTVVYYNELLKLFYVFLDYWNIPIIHREDVLQLDVGMRVDMRIVQNEPMKSIFKVEIIKRHF